MTSDNQVNVDFGLSAKAELKTEVPSEASGRAVHALVDAVSPFTETLGLIGDHIRAVRTSRAINRLQAAQSRIEALGKPINPVPDSFLIPWIEQTSRDEGDGLLTSMWENLLVSASLEFDPRMKAFPAILSELTNTDAKFLETICSSIEYSEVNIVHGINSHLVKVNDRLHGSKSTEEKLAGLMEVMESLDSPFIRCRSVEIQIEGNTKFRISDSYKNVGSGAAVMSKNGLIETHKETMRHQPVYRMDMEYFRLTRVGFEFVRAARGLDKGLQ